MSSRARTQWAANVLLWAVSYVVMGIRVASGPSMPYAEQLWIRRLGHTLVAILASALIGHIIWRTRSWDLRLRMGLAFALCILAGALYGMANYTVFYVINPLWEPERWLSGLMVGSVVLWVFVAWCAICFAMDYDFILKERTRNLLTTQNLALDAENRMLRAQINPHFLFNTLNALSALIIDKKNDEAERVLLLLSRVLRRSLDKDLPDLLTLREELKAQREYLRIEQVRFGRRLKVVERVPDELKEALVPSLILQPLVENAVKWGLGPSERPVTVEICAHEDAGRLCLSVADDGGGAFKAPPPRTGVGLQNVQRRLLVLFGGDARLVTTPVKPRGFKAALEMPMRRHDLA
ncbi:MAG TPA: histidine kinase, partial [Polyangiales bacterium]